MQITRIRYLYGNNIPYIEMTIDTGYKMPNTTNIKIAMANTIKWLRDEQHYAVVPDRYNRNDILAYATNPTFTDACRIREWIEKNDISRIFSQINEAWLDPGTNKWMVVVECYDEDCSIIQ